jgi:hypothetical protein
MLKPLTEGYLSQRSLIPCINSVSLSDTTSDLGSCKVQVWDGVYHVENHEIPFRIIGLYEEYLDRFTPCAQNAAKMAVKANVTANFMNQV